MSKIHPVREKLLPPQRCFFLIPRGEAHGHKRTAEKPPPRLLFIPFLGTNFNLHHGPDGVCPLYPLPRRKGLLHALPQKPARSQGTKAQIRPKGRGLVVSAKPSNAMLCCHLRKSRRGGGACFEQIKRCERERQQNTIPWSFPLSCWVIPPAREDAYGAGMVPLSTLTGRDCARAPLKGWGALLTPTPPPTHTP